MVKYEKIEGDGKLPIKLIRFIKWFKWTDRKALA
mgnify:FL=1